MIGEKRRETEKGRPIQRMTGGREIRTDCRIVLWEDLHIRGPRGGGGEYSKKVS